MISFKDNIYFEIILLSFLPGVEARYAVLYGIYKGMDVKLSIILGGFSVVMLSLILSMFIGVLDVIIVRISKRVKIINKLYHKYLNNIRRRFKRYEKYGILGLIIFVAIPLPVSGIYTGSFLSYILGLDRLKSFFILSSGGLISILIVTIPIILIV